MKRQPSPEAWKRVGPALARLYRAEVEREQQERETAREEAA